LFSYHEKAKVFYRPRNASHQSEPPKKQLQTKEGPKAEENFEEESFSQEQNEQVPYA
jgi:hypothetical protein